MLSLMHSYKATIPFITVVLGVFSKFALVGECGRQIWNHATSSSMSSWQQRSSKIARIESRDIDLTAKDVNGDTPLHEACFCGRLEITTVTVLLEKIEGKIKDCKGATIDSVITDKNDLGLTPFHLACREGNSEIVKVLIEFSRDTIKLVECVDCEGSTSLHLACQSDKADIVRSLIDEGASVGVFNHDGLSPVHVTAQFGSVAMMKELLDLENVVNMQDKYRQTPLHFASEYGKKDMVEYLIKMYVV